MYRHEWYQKIYERIPAIVEEARRFGEKLSLGQIGGQFGLYSGASSCPARLPNYVIDAIVEANKTEVLPVRNAEDELRALAKDIFGDAYDAAVVNTCEAALRVVIETLMAPPFMRKGDAYRGRMIFPYGEDIEWGAAYGRAFPPKYKNAAIDRSVSAGELAMEAKCLPNLDTIFVRFANARYEVHGIRQNIVPFLTGIDVDATIERMRLVSERHAGELCGFQTVGYDTPGYGYGEAADNGAPRLMQKIGALARDYDVPFLIDAASCVPGIGVSPEDAGADLMVWSMDKAGRSPAAGLIVGTEEAMLPVRKAIGLGGQRFGHVSSHGKAVHSATDPGRDTVVGLTAYMKVVRDDPDRIRRPVDQYHEMLVNAFKDLKPARFREKLIFTKSYHMGGTELNYSGTWDGDGFGIPLFTLEDLYADTNPICLATQAMGIEPATIYAGNMLLNPGLGLLDDEGGLIPERAELAALALVKSIEIVCTHAGLGD
ncbi:MAG: hypothetical protein V3R30_13850 [Kiloniellales bacterium]